MFAQRLRQYPLTHLTAFGYISVLTVVLLGTFNAVLLAFGWYGQVMDPPWKWQAGWFAIAFYIAWWTVFFVFDYFLDPQTADDCNVVPLPTFLEQRTPRRDASFTGADEAVEIFNDKAGNTIQTVSGILGFSLLIFSLTLTLAIAYPGRLDVVETILTKFILAVQIVAIVAFVIGMDRLDTCMNRFVDCSDRTRYDLTCHYYRKGIYYYYRGLVILIFSAFLSVMLVDPLIAPFGVAVLALLGYDYWFVHPRMYSLEAEGERDDMDEDVGRESEEQGV